MCKQLVPNEETQGSIFFPFTWHKSFPLGTRVVAIKQTALCHQVLSKSLVVWAVPSVFSLSSWVSLWPPAQTLKLLTPPQGSLWHLVQCLQCWYYRPSQLWRCSCFPFHFWGFREWSKCETRTQLQWRNLDLRGPPAPPHFDSTPRQMLKALMSFFFSSRTSIVCHLRDLLSLRPLQPLLFFQSSSWVPFFLMSVISFASGTNQKTCAAILGHA